MIVRDDFEHRLSAGLKRWAEAGEPTMDLESYVTGQPQAEPEAEPGTPVAEPEKPHRLSPRWRIGLTAAAVVLLLLTGGAVTFPRWAAAAAQWPIVGPLITNILKADPGLKWAYEHDLVNEPQDEITVGGITVRILGVMADARRTTVMYQVTGLPENWRSVPYSDVMSGTTHGSDLYPMVSIGAPPGAKTSWWSNWTAPEDTPQGVVGTASASPIPTPEADLPVTVSYRGQSSTIYIHASRTGLDQSTTELSVGKSQSLEGITVTVASVTYTPAEIIVKYRQDQPYLDSPVQTDPTRDDAKLKGTQGQNERATNASGLNGLEQRVFPRVDGTPTFVLPMVVKTADVDLRWPLTTGTAQSLGGNVITLQEWQQKDGILELHWTSTAWENFAGFGRFEVEDAAGRTLPLGLAHNSAANYTDDKGILHRRYEAPLPADFQPVAVHARQAGWKVYGPWQFELPPAP